jgi:hypothetical protein
MAILDTIRSEIRTGSLTRHFGRGGPKPLALFLSGVVVAATLASSAEAAERHADKMAAALSDKRTAAVAEFVDKMNSGLGSRIHVRVELTDPRGDDAGVIEAGSAGADATVCTAYVMTGPVQEVGVTFDAVTAFDWRTDPEGAAAAIQYDVANDVFRCLQNARGLGDGPAAKLAWYDDSVYNGQTAAGAAMLSAIFGRSPRPAEAERASFAVGLGDVESRRMAAAVGDGLREAASTARTWAAIGEASASIAARRMQFKQVDAERWRAPDGKVVSVVEGDAAFGWDALGGEPGEGPVFVRRFADPAVDRALNAATHHKKDEREAVEHVLTPSPGRRA